MWTMSFLLYGQSSDHETSTVSPALILASSLGMVHTVTMVDKKHQAVHLLTH